MRDILTVAEFTIKEAIKRKSFIISMIIIIGIIVIGFNVPNIINHFSNPNDNKEKILIMDNDNIFGESLIKIDNEDTNYEYTIIKENLSEDEILHMSCAIVDSAQVKGAKIYATKYTEAGMQKAATPTYPINESTSKLLQSDPNILEKAMTEIRTRYGNGNSAEIRNNYINSSINNQGEQAQSNLETKMEESVTNSKNSRKEYLDSLSGTTTE